GMGSLAILSLLFGVFSGYASSVLITIAKGFAVFSDNLSFVSVSSDQRIVLGDSFSSVSAMVILVAFIVAVAIVGFAVNYLVYKKQKQSIGATWDCGTDLQPRMEITAAGFSRSLVMIFQGILRPSVQHDIEYHDAETRYVPKSRTIIFGINNIYDRYLYIPVNNFITLLSDVAKKIQSGIINAYILYIFIALMVVLFSVAR
ncbi:MAG: hypothetical protein Q7S16_03600, partial [bacterium]|nr:hypothetical protein [bacterium]